MFEIDPGLLNRLIKLQSPSVTQDAAGAPGTDWTDVATVWAAIRPPTSAIMRSAREAFLGSARRDSVLHEVVIRYRPGVTAAMRATLGTRVFDLGVPIDPDEQSEWLVIPAVEGLTHG